MSTSLDISSEHLVYIRLCIFIASAFAFGAFLLFVPFVLNKLKPSEAKNSPYECGVEPQKTLHTHFNVHFYLVAMIFLVFDIEVVMMIPWAVASLPFKVLGFGSMMTFFSIVSASLAYEFGKKVI